MNNWNKWEEYRELFPTRYWEISEFDHKLSKLIDSNIKTVLDVGGGKYGTEILKNFNILVDLLDPNIIEKPHWMNNKVDWDDNKKYDLVVARGCINYLTKEELIKLKEKSNLIIFNTFLNKPEINWKDRVVKNKNNEEGLERVRFNNGKVEHILKFDNYIIKHDFFYYGEDDFNNIFKGIKIEKYKNGSAFCIFNN